MGKQHQLVPFGFLFLEALNSYSFAYDYLGVATITLSCLVNLVLQSNIKDQIKLVVVVSVNLYNTRVPKRGGV